MALWNLKGQTILVVDDFPEMRSMLRSMLQMYGADDVQQARHGEEAIELMEKHSFNIVLCDYNLGDGKDGQQVLEEAKHRQLLSYASTFIMVTAENTSEMVMGALEYQPDAYLSKPVTKTVLQARLRKLMEKKAMFGDIARALDRRDSNRVIRLCDSFIEQGTKYRFELLKLKADMLIGIGDFDAAEQLADAVLEERELAWAQMARGKVLFHRKDYEAAIGIFDAIIGQHPSFVAAYDWRAHALQRQGNQAEAQSTLEEAVAVSPKSILRQRALAEVADRNQDYATTEKARRQTIRVGRGSVLRQPTDYSGLARALVKQNSATKEAMKVLDQMGREFRGNPEAELAAAVTEATVLKAQGRDDDAQLALDRAIQVSHSQPQSLSDAVGGELLEVCLAQGRTEQANEVARTLVKNHHDDDDMLNRLAGIYETAGMAEAGKGLILDTQKEVIDINNQGVRLVNDGKIEESIDFFSNAVKSMPNNAVFNLNAAHSLVLHMKQAGATKQKLARALEYIQATESVELHREWRNNLMRACRNMAASLKAG